jgi:tetratricopeptide (TPR) repeat protein
MTAPGSDNNIVERLHIAFFIALLASPLGRAQTPSLKEVPAISVPTSTESGLPSSDMKHVVKELEYSDKVANDFVQMVSAWRNEEGAPALDAWKTKLNQAKQDYKKAKISQAQLAELEGDIAKELSQTIQKEISHDPSERFFDLADVIKYKQAQCLSYSQLEYITANSIGLSVQAIQVTELASGVRRGEKNHVANIITLTDGKTIMVDLGLSFISRPFILGEEYTEVGNYWDRKNRTTPSVIHREIQILDRNGLLANIINSRGCTYITLGQFSQAISDLTKAIKLNPRYAAAYSNRGAAYDSLGQYTEAISDCAKAIELNPKDAEAYSNRGAVYHSLGQYTEAISDLTKAIELKPDLFNAYYTRGNSRARLGQFPQAITDFTKVIEHDPNDARTYYFRGNAYLKLGFFPQAIADYTKALELNPKFAEAYAMRGAAYAASGTLGEAKNNLLKAVELSPALKPLVKQVSDFFKLDLQF